jgi:hypothetical protein
LSEEQKPQELIKQYYKIDFAKLAKLIFSDLEVRDKNNIFFKTFTKEQVINALQNPQKNEKTLRNVSSFLYILSPHYKRLCNYYAQMLKYDYYVEPYKLDFTKDIDKDKLKKSYFGTLYRLDNMNLKHEFQKILEIVCKSGIFYGYVHETSDSCFIQSLNPDFCQITSIEDGVYNFAFNFTYFASDESLLSAYPQEFRDKYNEYKQAKADKNVKRKELNNYIWREIDSKNSICIKSDETVPYSYPPFVSVLPDVFEISDYKALKKSGSEMENIALIAGYIPYTKDSDTANDFKLTLDTAIEFGNKITEALPQQIGFLLSPYEKMDLFRLNSDKVGTDKVEEAVNNFFDSAGVGKDLFTGSGSTDASQKRAITTDEQICFNLLRQLERWLNRRLKFSQESTYKFKATFLDITTQNQDYVVSRLQKSASYGVPVKQMLASALGLSPSATVSMNYLENDILDIPNNWKPLVSANTVSIKDNGRPSEEETNIESGGGE